MLYDLYDETLTVDPRYPRPGETGTLTFSVPGEPGSGWVLGLALGDWPGIPLRRVPGVGTEVLPLRDDALLRTSLSTPLAGVLDPSGVGTSTLAVPPNPWLIGFDLHAAGVTLQPSGFGTITNGLRLTIVR